MHPHTQTHSARDASSPAVHHWIAACDDVWIMWRSRRLPHFVCTRLAVGDGCDVASLSRPLWSDTPLLKCMTLLVDPSPVALPKVDLFHCYMLSARLWLSPLLPVEQPHLEKYPKKLSKSTENRIVSLLFTTFGKKKTTTNKQNQDDNEGLWGRVHSGRDMNEALVAFVMPQVFEHHFFWLKNGARKTINMDFDFFSGKLFFPASYLLCSVFHYLQTCGTCHFLFLLLMSSSKSKLWQLCLT